MHACEQTSDARNIGPRVTTFCATPAPTPSNMRRAPTATTVAGSGVACTCEIIRPLRCEPEAGGVSACPIVVGAALGTRSSGMHALA